MFSFFKKRIDILGYASHVIDHQWIYKTLIECKRQGLGVTFACSKGRLPQGVEESFEDSGISIFYDVSRSFMQKLKAPIVVTASSGLEEGFFSRKYCKYRVHMPHSIASLHMIYPQNAFDGYNVLLAAGPHHCEEFRALGDINNASERFSFPCGYGKFDALMQKQASKGKGEHSKEHILIAPSWGDGNILNVIGFDLIEKLLDASYQVTLRPHPVFFIEESPIIKKLQTQFCKHNAFTIEDSSDENLAIHQADIMISDYSGVAHEFSVISGNPVLFVDVPCKIVNEHWRNIDITPIELKSRGCLGPLVEVGVDQIVQAVEKTLVDQKEWRIKSRAFEQEFLYSRNCAQNAAYYLKELQKKDPKEIRPCQT